MIRSWICTSAVPCRTVTSTGTATSRSPERTVAERLMGAVFSRIGAVFSVGPAERGAGGMVALAAARTALGGAVRAGPLGGEGGPPAVALAARGGAAAGGGAGAGAGAASNEISSMSSSSWSTASSVSSLSIERPMRRRMSSASEAVRTIVLFPGPGV